MTNQDQEPEILNPRYAGATPAAVARALVRRDAAKLGGGDETEPRAEDGADGRFQSVYNPLCFRGSQRSVARTPLPVQMPQSRRPEYFLPH